MANYPRPQRPSPAQRVARLRHLRGQRAEARRELERTGLPATLQLSRIAADERWDVDAHCEHDASWDGWDLDALETMGVTACQCSECTQDRRVPILRAKPDEVATLLHDLFYDQDEDVRTAVLRRCRILGYSHPAQLWVDQLRALDPGTQEIAAALLQSWKGTFEDLLNAAAIA